jgi:hypothetical protein
MQGSIILFGPSKSMSRNEVCGIGRRRQIDGLKPLLRKGLYIPCINAGVNIITHLLKSGKVEVIYEGF